MPTRRNLPLQSSFPKPLQKTGAIRRVRVHRVVCDMGTGYIRLQREGMSKSFAGFVDPSEQP